MHSELGWLWKCVRDKDGTKLNDIQYDDLMSDYVCFVIYDNWNR